MGRYLNGERPVQQLDRLGRPAPNRTRACRPTVDTGKVERLKRSRCYKPSTEVNLLRSSLSLVISSKSETPEQQLESLSEVGDFVAKDTAKRESSKVSRQYDWTRVRAEVLRGVASVPGIPADAYDDIVADKVGHLVDLANAGNLNPDYLDAYAYTSGQNAARDYLRRTRYEAPIGDVEMERFADCDNALTTGKTDEQSKPSSKRMSETERRFLENLGKLREHLIFRTRYTIVETGVIFCEPEPDDQSVRPLEFYTARQRDERRYYQYIATRITLFCSQWKLPLSPPQDLVDKLVEFRRKYSKGFHIVSAETLNKRVGTAGHPSITLGEYERLYETFGIRTELNGEEVLPITSYELSDHSPLAQLARRIVDRAFHLSGFNAKRTNWLARREAAEHRKRIRKAANALRIEPPTGHGGNKS